MCRIGKLIRNPRIRSVAGFLLTKTHEHIMNNRNEGLEMLGVFAILACIVMGGAYLNNLYKTPEPSGLIKNVEICELVEPKDCDEEVDYCFDEKVNCMGGNVHVDENGYPSQWNLVDGAWHELWNSYDVCHWDDWCNVDSEHKTWRITLPKYSRE